MKKTETEFILTDTRPGFGHFSGGANFLRASREGYIKVNGLVSATSDFAELTINPHVWVK